MNDQELAALGNKLKAALYPKSVPSGPPPAAPLVWGGLSASDQARVMAGEHFSPSELVQLTPKQLEHYHAIKVAR